MKQLEFYKVYNWAAFQLGGLCTPETMIFSVMYSYHEAKKECFCSYSEFERIIGCCHATVSTAINKLCTIGIIEKYTRGCEYRNSNTYEINESMVKIWKSEFNAGKLKKPKKLNKDRRMKESVSVQERLKESVSVQERYSYSQEYLSDPDVPF